MANKYYNAEKARQAQFKKLEELRNKKYKEYIYLWRKNV
jgi:hypothetical protein